jgi:hypothetical protein
VADELSDYFIRNCRIAFKCDQSWESLTETRVASVRHCSKCSKDVVRCNNVKQLKQALLDNACVAIKFSVLVPSTELMTGLVVPIRDV